MDKNAIKKFAIWARRELIERVSQRAAIFGITAEDHGEPEAESINGRLLSSSEKHQRKILISNIKEKGFEQVIEEVAYTWFNRFAALRFMEVNGYLPSHVRVFTNDAGEFKPQILSEAIHLELDGLNMDKVYELENANKTEELFKYLLVVQCNALNSILPGMFQRIDDYTELLLPDNLLREGSVIERLVIQGASDSIPESDWTDQVQIIGWLYQYYNTEPKDKVFSDLKKNIKITKEKIPAATQLFTPDWIVHYMVENSLGRLWLEGHPNDSLKSEWKYYLEEAEQEPKVQEQLKKIQKEYAGLKPEEIKVIDPCSGSGHILCVLFDVLVRIYEDFGHTAREAVTSIIKNNIWGLDIDERAAQLSYFAVMMKARQYDRRFLTRKDSDGNPDIPQPHVYVIEESNGIKPEALNELGQNLTQYERNNAIEQINKLIEEMYDAKEYGSLTGVSVFDWNLLRRFAKLTTDNGQMRINMHDEEQTSRKLQKLIDIGEALAQKYEVVVTNPPYRGLTDCNSKLNNFVIGRYSDAKTDLYSAFILKCLKLTNGCGFTSMITMSSWMYLSSFKQLRKSLISSISVENMLVLGSNAFDSGDVGTVVQTTSFVIRLLKLAEKKSVFVDLDEPTTSDEKKSLFFKKSSLFVTAIKGFSNTANCQFMYDASPKMLLHFKEAQPFSSYATARAGMQTSDNDRFLRLWEEIEFKKIGFGLNHDEASRSEFKWFPYNKGIGYRKWYGNNDYVVNFYHDGEELKYWLTHNPNDISTTSWSRNLRNYSHYFEEGITFTAIGLAFSARLNGPGYLFDTKGPTMFGANLFYLCGFVNSVVFDAYNRTLCKRMTKSSDSVNMVPVIMHHIKLIEDIVVKNVELSKSDWDSQETSWSFKKHPFIECKPSDFPSMLENIFNDWKVITVERFFQLKKNEEELNRIFIDIYGLQEELSPEVEDKDITVRKADLQRDIKSFISYSVGCMFGRYSLDVPGLVYAGGIWDPSKYTTFPADEDAILPICDDEYFEDDIVGLFISFVEKVYGKETLEENLQFIADALGGKGTSREIIRNYFINGFYADHVKVYQKRPIYWLFDSGKKNGFKCLIYLHRYKPDTIARIRTDYIHEQQSRYRTAIDDLNQRINGATASDKVKLGKKLTQVQEQAEELRIYEEKIHHLADQMIEIDLDDGVKVNYAKFEDVLAKIK